MDFGNGLSNMKLFMEIEFFWYFMFVIGFFMVNNEKKVVVGELDENIKKLGVFLLSLGECLVFLWIGYEFDGYFWNYYDKESWKIVYKWIKD